MISQNFLCYIISDNTATSQQLSQLLDGKFEIKHIDINISLKNLKQSINGESNLHLIILAMDDINSQLLSLLQMTKPKKNFNCISINDELNHHIVIDYQIKKLELLDDSIQITNICRFLAEMSHKKQLDDIAHQAKINLLTELTKLTRDDVSTDNCICALSENLAFFCQSPYYQVYNLEQSNTNLPVTVIDSLKEKKVKVIFDDQNKDIQQAKQKDEQIQGSLTFPILCGEDIICVIHCYILKKSLDLITLDSISIVEQACTQLSIILERKKAMKTLEQQHKELQEAIHELQTTKEQLYQSEKLAAVGQLSAGIAHEINNPLSFVRENFKILKSYTAILTETLESYNNVVKKIADNSESESISENPKKRNANIKFVLDDVDSLIVDSTDGLDRIRDIIENLLKFSRKGKFEGEFFDIEEGIDSTLKILNNQLKYGITVEKHYGNLPKIECNGGMLNQVFMNLLQNSVHALDGKGTIKIKTWQQDNYAYLSFHDNGPGIPEKIQRQIFNPFFTTKPVNQGTGLGLSISHGIIEKHQGEITLKSEMNEFSEFIIKLPISCSKHIA